MLNAVLAWTFLATVCGLILGYAATRFKKAETDPLIDRIDAILPQTQCGRCSYPGCRPYATAIVSGAADINQCPPGGEAAIAALARLLGRAPKPLNTAYGTVKPKMVAVIDELRCIGCTLCIHACPVDAILGAAKHMHTVIAQECTGCELCVPPCPVDCIDMVPVKQTTGTAGVCPSNIPLVEYYRFVKSESAVREREKRRADIARKRHEFRLQRLEREKMERAAKHEQKKATLSGSVKGVEGDARQAVIQAAIERARAKHGAGDERPASL